MYAIRSYYGNGLGAINLRFPLDTVGRHLVGPGKEQDDRKTQGQDQHDGLHDPGGRADIVQHEVRHLCQQPAGDDVTQGYAEDIAALELLNYGQGLASEWPRITSYNVCYTKLLRAKR